MSAQAVHVARCRCHRLQEAEVFKDSVDERREKRQEDDVLSVIGGGFQKISPLAVDHGDVDVFAASVHVREGFFVKEEPKLVFARQLPHRLHDDLVLVAGEICIREKGGELELTPGDLVVPRRDGDADARQIAFDVLHVGEHPLRDRSEIMVVELLVFGGLSAE